MTSKLSVLRCPQRRQGDLFAAPAVRAAAAAPRGPQSIWAGPGARPADTQGMGHTPAPAAAAPALTEQETA